MNLPKSFTAAAGKYGIKKEEFIFAAMADFDAEYRFADSVIALTKEKLVLAAYPYREKAEYRFGGYGGWQFTDSVQPREKADSGDEMPAVQIFALEGIGKMEVLRQVAAGVLLAEVDGVERNLCHFSNTKMEMFLRLCKLCEKVKKG